MKSMNHFSTENQNRQNENNKIWGNKTWKNHQTHDNNTCHSERSEESAFSGDSSKISTVRNQFLKPLRYFVFAILVAGFSLSGRAVYMHAKAELASILIHRAWQETTTTGKPCAPWPWADYHPVARLRIPRLGYDEIILDAATPRTLAFGPARLLSGAAFGEPGNVEIAGHRDSWFLPLKSIAVGDTIELQWFDTRTNQLRNRTYRVQSLDVVNPENTSLLAPTSDDALTLITCYPFSRSAYSPQRFVIRAIPQPHSKT